eukprot:jgi/Mesvir1/15945/Mv08264-RA.1
MKVVALVSGGKDSCYNILQCEAYGHEVVALANLLPPDAAVDDMDSYMYQTVGHQLVGAYAACTGLPLFRRKINGTALELGLGYVSSTRGDEVEDLYQLLLAVTKHIPDVKGVSCGAIASDYQRTRVENVCGRLGLVSLAFMWRRPQAVLLQEMIDVGIHAIFVKVAAMGLDPKKHLGKTLRELAPTLFRCEREYGCNVCGEGGEYETMVLDAPIFKRARIVLDEWAVRISSPSPVAAVGLLHPLSFHVEPKAAAQGGAAAGVAPPASASTHGGLVIECNYDDAPLRSTGAPPLQSPAQAGSQAPSASTFVAGAAGGHSHPHARLRVWQSGSGFLLLSGDVCPQDVGTGAGAGLLSGLTQHEGAPGNDDAPPGASTRHQVHSVLTSMGRWLERQQLCWGDVFYTRVYLHDMADFVEMNEEYQSIIRFEHCPQGVPSRACVQMPLPTGTRVMVEAAVLSKALASAYPKKVLHVQSVSRWAPSCIGPYSQATSHQGLLYMAGQLGLDPPTMQLVEGPALQMAVALMNCEAVAEAYGAPLHRGHALAFTVFCHDKIGTEGRAAAHAAFLAHPHAVTASRAQQAAAEEAISSRMATLAMGPSHAVGARKTGNVLDFSSSDEDEEEGNSEGGRVPSGGGSTSPAAGVASCATDGASTGRPGAACSHPWFVDGGAAVSSSRASGGCGSSTSGAGGGGHLAPFATWVVVPGLPKGACVEVAPVAQLPETAGIPQPSAGEGGAQLSMAAQDAGLNWQQFVQFFPTSPACQGAVEHTGSHLAASHELHAASRHDPLAVDGEAAKQLIRCRSLYRFRKLFLWRSVVPDASGSRAGPTQDDLPSQPDLDSTFHTCWRALADGLEKAGMSWQELTECRIYSKAAASHPGVSEAIYAAAKHIMGTVFGISSNRQSATPSANLPEAQPSYQSGMNASDGKDSFIGDDATNGEYSIAGHASCSAVVPIILVPVLAVGDDYTCDASMVVEAMAMCHQGPSLLDSRL